MPVTGHAILIEGNVLLIIEIVLFITLKSLGLKVVGGRINRIALRSIDQLLDETGFSNYEISGY